jgi:dephospho-CoA kinase
LIVLAITTNSSVRYQRLATREFRPLTYEQARSRDISEIENLEKGGPISIADYYIDNNGSVEDLQAQFNQFINWLNK